MAELFTEHELEEIRERAHELAVENEEDAGLRSALLLFSEAADNLIPKVRAAGAAD